jgi:glycosyltransferase involved in cell wall biosynthesis
VHSGLQRQTLPLYSWEYLIIDNNSQPSLAENVDLGWHPYARVVREEQLGLTAARLRGIKESTAALLVFVDDDNVLAADFLEQAIAIHDRSLAYSAPAFLPRSSKSRQRRSWSRTCTGLL